MSESEIHNPPSATEPEEDWEHYELWVGRMVNVERGIAVEEEA